MILVGYFQPYWQFYGAAVELIISDRLCFIGFTNLFIWAIVILVKSHIGAPLVGGWEGWGGWVGGLRDHKTQAACIVVCSVVNSNSHSGPRP